MENDKPKVAPTNEWPIAGTTVKLARNLNAPKEDGQIPYYQPPTIDGSIVIGMEAIIFVPSLDVQKTGFTPYKKVDGKPVDATKELMAHYAGIYKHVVNP